MAKKRYYSGDSKEVREIKKTVKDIKRHPVAFAAVVIILAAIIAIIAVLWFAKPELFHKYLGTGDHSFTEWETVEERNCGKDGLQKRVCTVCGEEEEEILSATGEHDWGGWEETKAASCGDGAEERECSICHETDKQIIAGTGLHTIVDEVCTTCGYSPSPTAVISNSELSIHFLELGNKYTGDCTLIKYGDTEILIDAGSRQGSAATIKSYVDEYCTDGVLEYVIATHAHQDHIAGFVGNGSGTEKTGILYQYKVGTLIQFAGHNTTSAIYKNYCTAVEYAKTQGAEVYTANECWYQTNGAKKQYFIDEAQKISINILYNYYYDHETNDENDYSVCMLLKQETPDGEKNYLFTGDLESKGESYLVDNNALPEVELFKGGHHGSYTATTDKLLKVINPKNVAVCCCCGTTEYTTNAANTFPAQAFIDRVSKYTANIYCTTLITDYKNNEYTSMNGNIVFYVRKGSNELQLWCSNNDTVLKETDWFKDNRTWNGI